MRGPTFEREDGDGAGQESNTRDVKPMMRSKTNDQPRQLDTRNAR